MKLLILGQSSIAARRVLPALQSVSAISGIDVASRRPIDPAFSAKAEIHTTYTDYGDAIAQSDAGLVYVSLPNSAHAPFAEAALDAGKHVVVDKPAFLTLAETESLARKAKANGLCLAEATVFADHPQVAMLRELARPAGSTLRVTAHFSIPPLPPENFRYRPELGGGAFLDMAPYAAATGRLLFADTAATAACTILTRQADTDVDTAFSMMVTYPGGGCFVGHFGFDTEYQNRLVAFGPDIAVTVDRLFTTPADTENNLHVASKNEQSTLTAPPGDTFALFFDRVCRAIGNRDFEPLRTDMVLDAAFIQKLRENMTELSK